MMRGTAVDDYLKALWKLQTPEELVTTTALSARMGTTAAAATKMLKHLAALELVSYTPYHGARLTRFGERSALEVIRHHRLLERWLVEAMGYTWDQVDAEAERLEHAISEEFEARMDALLGHPAVCPHGDPIPAPDGTLTERRWGTLAESLPGQTVILARVRDTDPALLRALSACGIHLGTHLQILASPVSGGPYTVRVEDTEQEIAPALAAIAFVAPLKLALESQP